MLGFWAAVIVAVITTILILAAIAMGGIAGLPALSAWSFIDVGIYVAIAIGIRRFSRIAAILGLIMYVADRVYLWTVVGVQANAGIIFTIFLTLAFIHGVRGTFAYHTLRKNALANDEAATPLPSDEMN